MNKLVILSIVIISIIVIVFIALSIRKKNTKAETYCSACDDLNKHPSADTYNYIRSSVPYDTHSNINTNLEVYNKQDDNSLRQTPSASRMRTFEVQNEIALQQAQLLRNV